MDELIERSIELLQSLEYPNIATVSSEGLPWNTPVYAVCDSELRFYWSSWKSAEHSKNVRENPAVFLTLYDSTRRRGDNNRRCFYAKAEAFEVKDAQDIRHAIELLYPSEAASFQDAQFQHDAQRRMYRASLSHCWLNDKSEREVTAETLKMRIPVPLDPLRTAWKRTFHAGLR